MEPERSRDEALVKEWLSRLYGRGPETRKLTIAEMRAAGAERLFPFLAPMLADPDPEVRCLVCEAVLLVEPGAGVDLVLPLVNDREVVVRWQACGCLHDFGDERAVAPLIQVLENDPDAQVRGTAAYALGGIGDPRAIPALLAALESDHEYDELGHSPSSSAATALDEILGTDETRIRVSESLCRMAPGKPDLRRLRELAEAIYQQWKNASA
jgi:HEAT repeat protein